MKKLFSFVAVAAIFVLFSCKKSDDTATSSTANSKEIVPTATGSTWKLTTSDFGIYADPEEPTYTDTAVVVGTKVIGSETFSILRAGWPSEGFFDTTYFRNTDTSLIEISRSILSPPKIILLKPSSSIVSIDPAFQEDPYFYYPFSEKLISYPGTIKINGIDCYKNILYLVSKDNVYDTAGKEVRYFKMGMGRVLDSIFEFNNNTRNFDITSTTIYTKVK